MPSDFDPRRTKKSDGGGSSEASKTTKEAPKTQSSLPSFSDKSLASNIPKPPTLSVPKGGGAVRGIGEKFNVNPNTGLGTTSIPINVSPARGVEPTLTLSYSSGEGNGPFGLGWDISLGRISRKTDKGLPRYQDAGEDDVADVFLIDGSEDLVPVFKRGANGQVIFGTNGRPAIDETAQGDFIVRRYMPRIEGNFSRVERWMNTQDPSNSYWRTISPTNRTTIFGNNPQSRVFDPIIRTGEALRTFQWLVSEVYDPQGNAMVFEYKPENSDNVSLEQANEENRTDLSRSAGRYLKRIRYGNSIPNRDLSTWTPSSASTLPEDAWRYSVIFDYGEHDAVNPKSNDSGKWACRIDPHSTYRSGFEIRTYRLCQRIFMFHHFKELEVQEYLVGSTDLEYDHDPVASRLVSASHSGYVWDNTTNTYIRKRLPPLELEYSAFPTDEELEHAVIRDIDQQGLENLPIGLSDQQYSLVDLNSEGLSGILIADGGQWLYKQNLSTNATVRRVGESEEVEESPPVARFAPPRVISPLPATSIEKGEARFGDVSGLGKLDVIEMGDSSWGFFERTDDGAWEPFRAFPYIPNINTQSADVKYVDLTGDGLADILIYADQVYHWFPSVGRDGYGPGVTVSQPWDEKKGPIRVYSDAEETIHLADMSGDGLIDLVRIRNSDICYWPNLGYGCFGSRVPVDNAPCFDRHDRFDIKRVLFADIDGNGLVDMLYLGQDGIDLYLNQAGNSFSSAKRLGSFSIDNMSNVTVVDLLGTGTSCVVWSSPAPSASFAPMQYLDILRSQKPRLLRRFVNNLGVETTMHYAPSTKFYLDDMEKGRPWLTRIHFPVHCVEKVEVIDRISGNKFVNEYKYHHGFYDDVEREFRGFAMAEHWDTERYSTERAESTATNMEKSWQAPPVLVKTWYHTGVYLNNETLSRQMAQEYYGAPSPFDSVESETNFLSTLLDDTVLPSESLGAIETREACRALKGHVLRTEIYAEDDTAQSGIPYRVEESNFTIEVLQPVQDSNAHAVFMVHPRETISYVLDRNITDPRIQHTLVLETDRFGHPLKNMEVAYGRLPGKTVLAGTEKSIQEMMMIMYTETDYTNGIDGASDYLLPVPCEVRQYQITRLPKSGTKYHVGEIIADNFAALSSLSEIPFEQPSDGRSSQKRLISRSKTFFRKDDLSGDLPLAKVEPMMTSGIEYSLCFTPKLLSKVFKRQIPGSTTEDLLPNPPDILAGTQEEQAGYVDLDGNGSWWKPSGRSFFHPDPKVSSSAELAEARNTFFLPSRHRNVFGANTTVAFDGYKLFPVSTQDAAGNVSAVRMDYRVLEPRILTDPNQNQTAVAFDALGIQTGTAVMGKATEITGDSLANFKAELSQAEMDLFFSSPTQTLAATLLGDATSRTIHDPNSYYRDTTKMSPVRVATISRETHKNGPLPPGGARYRISFAYSDGFERIIQAKDQAKPGPITESGSDVIPRWIGSGWTIYNNKGQPVKQFEPFFDDTHRFRFDMRIGYSPTLIYDSIGRLVATLRPDHSIDKHVFTPWSSATFDANDNCLISDPRDDPDIGQYFRELPSEEFLPSWYNERKSGSAGKFEAYAAKKAAEHFNTPTTNHFDALGRSFFTTSDNGPEGLVNSRSTYDIQGNKLETVDARNRVISRTDHDMTGTPMHHVTMDGAGRWILSDAEGGSLYAWNSRGDRQRSSYDILRRPLGSFWKHGSAPEVLVQKAEYGEAQPNAEANNLRDKTYSLRDQAGITITSRYDVKGNVVNSIRRLAVEYKETLDWSAANVPLQERAFESSTKYDALNRPVFTTVADGTVRHQKYNEAGLLDQVFLNVRGESTEADPLMWKSFIKRIDRNAKGQTTRIDYGNGAVTVQEFDPKTMALQRMQTKRPSPTVQGSYQDLKYTYDAVGNITHIQDDAQQTIYFRGGVVEPSSDYTYNAVYRLMKATGREHLGQAQSPVAPSATDLGSVSIDDPLNGSAMARYEETYTYDSAGNILSIKHAGSDASAPGWTRNFSYNEASMIPGASQDMNNRLSSSTIGSTSESYRYEGDAGIHGLLTSMPGVSQMEWDFMDRLRSTSRQKVNNGTPETTYYLYDSGGQRLRKITERAAAEGESPTRLRETLYLGTLQIYREYDGDGETIKLERETLDVQGDKARVALVETRTQGTDPSPQRLTRFQIGNLIGSAILELDDQGLTITYEEYFPFGSSSFRAARSQTEAPKRYRYSGKERDEESGLYYFGARYYAPWVARWIAPDPGGNHDGPNLYEYCGSNPIKIADATGTTGEDTTAKTLAQMAEDVAKYPSGHLQRFINYAEGRIYQEAVQNIGQRMLGGTKLLREVVVDAHNRLDGLIPGQHSYEKKTLEVALKEDGALNVSKWRRSLSKPLKQFLKHTESLETAVKEGRDLELFAQKGNEAKAITQKLVIIVKGAKEPAMLKTLRTEAKAYAAKKLGDAKKLTIGVFSAENPRIAKEAEKVRELVKAEDWALRAEAASAELLKRVGEPAATTAARNATYAASKVAKGAVAGVKATAKVLAPVAKVAGPIVGALTFAGNVETLSSSESTTGQKVVAAMELATTVMSFIPATAVVGGVLGVGLALFGNKIAEAIDGPKPTPAPVQQQPVEKKEEGPLIV